MHTLDFLPHAEQVVENTEDRLIYKYLSSSQMILVAAHFFLSKALLFSNVLLSLVIIQEITQLSSNILTLVNTTLSKEDKCRIQGCEQSDPATIRR